MLTLPFLCLFVFPELSHPSGLGAQYENPHWGLSSNSSSSNASSSTGWGQVIIDENDSEAWPSISVGNSHAAPECPADAERSADVRSSSSMSMATGAGQPAHYPINKSSASHPASMVSSQGGPSRGWGAEGKADGLAMGGRGQPNWSSPNLNLNPSANPAAWPMLGHEGPNMGGGGGMGGSNSLPPNMCGAGGAPNGNGNMGNGNGNLMGDSTGTGAWGNPDGPEQRQSPAANVSFSMEPPNLNTDGPNHTNKPEPMSPVHGWGGQSPTESSQTNGDGTAIWGGSSGGDSKANEPKESGWDSGNVSWGRGGGNGNSGSGGGGNWGDWEKQSSGEASGWDSADAPQQEPMSSWNTEAPASEGSGDSSEGHSRRRERSSSSGSIPLLPRQDLDPRVLSNTGWGQTPVRQHTVWEMEEICPERKSESGTEGWGSSSGASPAGPPPMSAGGANPNLGGAPRPDSGGKNEPAGPVGSASGWGSAPPPPKQSVTGWGEPPASKKVSNGSMSGWGDPVPSGPNSNGPKSSQSWGSEEKSPSWDDGPAQSKQQQQQQGWGEPPKQSQGWGNGSGGGGSGVEWGDASEVKKNGTGNPMWEGEGNNWKENPRNGSGNNGGGGGWGKPAPSMGGNWGEAPPRSNGPGPGQGWGGKPQEGPSGGNNGAAPTMGSWGGPNSVKQSSGWGSGGRSDSEATGWEEPSPPSIRRKMEIDDGTSTWGDPSAYSKAVNMWDRNNPTQGNSGPGNNSSGGGNSNNHPAPNNNNNHHHHHHHPHHNQAPMQNHSNGSNNNGSPNQPGPPQNRPPLVTPGKSKFFHSSLLHVVPIL